MAYYKCGRVYTTQNSNTVIDNASGPIANFNTQLCLPLLGTKLGFNAKQDCHGYDGPWMDSTVLDKKPYLLQSISGTASRYGNYLYDKLIGGTVAFNQLIQNGNFATDDGWTKTSEATLSISNNKAVIHRDSGTSVVANLTLASNKKFTPINGHKYLFSLFIKTIHGLAQLIPTSAASDGATGYAEYPNRTNLTYVWNCQTTEYVNCNIRGYTGNGVTSEVDYEVDNFICIDLTQMFGSTIADYIYNLEQATSGAGVAFFKNLFPNDYYAYNTGELMSVKTTAHVIRDASNTVIGNYALDSNLELRGIPKLDANNNLYYDGDIYESSGKVTRKYGVVDLGSLTWVNFYSSYGIFRATLDNMKVPSSVAERKIGFLCPKYSASSVGSVDTNMDDKSILRYSTYIVLRDTTYTDASQLATALSGAYLIYELATPTTETGDPFTNPQVSDQYGTEEYVDARTIPIPVGHETYQANICPIEGVSEVKYTHYGKNMFDLNYLSASGITIQNGEVSGTATAFNSSFGLTTGGLKNKFKFRPNTKYTISFKAYTDGNESQTGRGLTIFFKYTDTTSSSVYCPNDTLSYDSFSAISALNKTIDYIAISYTTSGSNIWHIKEIQLEENTDVTTYEPYAGSSALIQLGDTYYGGEVIIDKNGKRKFVVTHEVFVFAGTESWQTSTNFFYLPAGTIDNSPVQTRVIASNGFSINPMTNGQIRLYPSYGINSDYISMESTVADIQGYLFNGIGFIYELAEPFIVDLPDGTPIKSIPGVNNIYCDTGDTSLQFRKIQLAS